MMESFFKDNFRDFLIITATCLLLTLLVWLPHYLGLADFLGLKFGNGFSTIYRNFDGLEYIVIAKSLYNPGIIAGIPLSLPANYYASHFPGFALLILVFAPMMGFLKSMIFTSTLFTILSALAFYLLLKNFKLSSQPLFLSLLFLLLPARWLIVHSVGSAEPVFIFFVIACFYFFLKFEESKKYLYLILSAVFGLFTQLTRPPGILLFLGISAFAFFKFFKEIKNSGFKKAVLSHLKYLPFMIIPLGLLGVFYWYQLSYNDFFAYFHSGDNIHLALPPFQIFNKHQFWVGEIWLEDVIYVFLLGFYGGILLLRKSPQVFGFFVLVYISATSLVAHRDISRYALPIFPFLLIAFEKVLTSKEFKIALLIILPAIYLYTQNFLIENTAPIPELKFFD